jgi:hypothetical protein
MKADHGRERGDQGTEALSSREHWLPGAHWNSLSPESVIILAILGWGTLPSLCTWFVTSMPTTHLPVPFFLSLTAALCSAVVFIWKLVTSVSERQRNLLKVTQQLPSHKTEFRARL